MDCSHEDPYELATTGPGNKKKKPQKVHPEITIRGDAAKKLMSGGLATGTEFSSDAIFRVVEVRDRAKGNSPYPGDSGAAVTLQLIDLGEPEDASMGGEEESAEDALDKYEEGRKGK